MLEHQLTTAQPGPGPGSAPLPAPARETPAAAPGLCRVRYLKVVFDLPLQPQEIPALRGALIEKLGRAQDLLHNHSDEGHIHRYPLIQYKCLQGKAALIGLNQGADALQALFADPDRCIRFRDQPVTLQVQDLRMQQVVLRTWNKRFHYRIHNWIALQDDAYTDYLGTDSLAKRAAILERRLQNTLVSLAKGLGWEADAPITAELTHFWQPHKVRFKGVVFLAFNAEFNTNVYLPDHVALGKAGAFGFGTIHPLQAPADENP